MRKLIFIFMCFTISTNALAFKDEATLAATRELISRLQQQTTVQEKAANLERFKKFLFNRLNTIDVPDITQNSLKDPRIEEYRSLTEFDTYVNMISIKKINASSCAAATAHIRAATGADMSAINSDQQGAEALMAQQIIEALCH